MSDPSVDSVPIFEFTLTVSLPESATDEQRQAFFRELERLGGTSALTVTVGLDPSVPPEKREVFAAALRSALEPPPV